MQVAIIGTGYVGLVSGACFADFGHVVTCADLDEQKIARLSAGEVPIFEPGLDELVADNVRAGRLRFSTALDQAVEDADVVFIVVGTPSRRGDGHPDLTFINAAARSIAAALRGFTVVVNKSTVPIGTGDAVERIIAETNPSADFCVVSNPEFLREGAAIADFKRPDRIVIGVEDERGREVMAELYRPLSNETPLLFVSRRSAELTKYAANGFLAMKIAYINEIADLCEAVGADIQDVARGIGLDNRIGARFLNAGPGYGGSCFPKDALALIGTAKAHDGAVRLIETTVAINADRKRRMAEKVIAACGGDVRGKTIAVLGLTFKPNTDDLRESPGIAITAALQQAGAAIRAFDPHGLDGARNILAGVVFGSDAYEAATGADALVIATEWDAFRALDFGRLRQLMRAPVLVDLRNIYRGAELARHGFSYRSVGRPGEDVDAV